MQNLSGVSTARPWGPRPVFFLVRRSLAARRGTIVARARESPQRAVVNRDEEFVKSLKCELGIPRLQNRPESKDRLQRSYFNRSNRRRQLNHGPQGSKGSEFASRPSGFSDHDDLLPRDWRTPDHDACPYATRPSSRRKHPKHCHDEVVTCLSDSPFDPDVLDPYRSDWAPRIQRGALFLSRSTGLFDRSSGCAGT